MRKIVIIIVLGILMLFTGCSNNGKHINQNKEGKKQALEIIRCFDENDNESLKKMFCEEIQNSNNLDKEISKAMDFYNGTCVSHDRILISGGIAVDDGVVTDNHIEYSIKNIVTTEDKTYRIATHSYLLHENTDYEGITYLTLIDSDSKSKCEIGKIIY